MFIFYPIPSLAEKQFSNFTDNVTSLGYGTYMFFGALMVLIGFWAYLFIAETKGETLEEMDELFGAPSIADLEGKGAGTGFERDEKGLCSTWRLCG